MLIILQIGEEEVIFTNERLDGVGIYNDYLFYIINHGVRLSYEYICPINGNPYTDSIELNSMVEKKGTSGQEKHFIFEGIAVGGNLYPEEDYFKILYVREKKTNNKILYGVDHSIIVDGDKIIFWKETQNPRYSSKLNQGILEKNIYYTFDWQAGYLIVLSDDKVITAYKVE